ncbi:MAG: SDR family oxidoreductase [Planctomycetota bacterium]
MSIYGVTAASGKLGSQVVRAMKSLVGSDRVVGLARTPTKATSLGVEIRPGDYELVPELEESLRGIKGLLLVSGMDAPEKRIGQHRNVIHAAKCVGVKRIVYTSIQGHEEGNAFSPIVQSNRETERDVRESGLEWVIGRNGIYIEPDTEYIESYKENGEIANCAGSGKCGYTTRDELANAYAKMLTEDSHVGNTYNLHGEAITQTQLASYLNVAFGTKLQYRSISVAAFREDRIAALGEFLGTVIAGIYEGIRDGAVDNVSHYRAAAGREHYDWQSYFASLPSGLSSTSRKRK